MNIKQKNKEGGFTIIEVVLVLAIAGLIFLMVFMALPALQRSQRDTARRSNVSTFVSQLTSYSTNNRGKIPGSSELPAFQASYLKWKSDETGEFNDPKTGNGYVIKYGTTGGGSPITLSDGEMYYSAAATCSGENSITSTNTREAAVVVKLEGGGNFCQSNK